MMTVVAVKSDYIYSANTVYQNLREMEDAFYEEAQVVNYVKCVLLRNEELDDFYIGGVVASVYKKGDSYSIYFDKYVLDLDTYGKQIIDINLKAS